MSTILPRTLTAPNGVLTREQCQTLFQRIQSLSTGGGNARLGFTSKNTGGSKWARNRMTVSSDVNEYVVRVDRDIRGADGYAVTTSVDEDRLREVVLRAENALRYTAERPPVQLAIDRETLQDQPTLQPVLWSESTYAFDAGKRTKLAQEMMAPAESNGLQASGDFLITANAPAVIDNAGLLRYYLTSEVQCSITIRDPRSAAAGWAGANHFDLARIDPMELATRALNKCQKSRNPVAIEPGRYTAILEPQAVADLFDSVVRNIDNRPRAESMQGPYSAGFDLSKVGERILDARLNVVADPMAPDSGFVPFDTTTGEAYQAVKWVERGVLKDLAYDRAYSRKNFGKDLGLPNSQSYMLTPAPDVPTATLDEMIAATKRGVLVTRFWGVQVIEERSLMSYGFTRDGLWLIENGAIKHPIKNFRFTDSPLFALNSLEQVGTPVRVFSPGRAVLAPPVRVRDFNFSSMTDAV